MKRKVIIDCDPGIDDSLAIMMALNSKEIEVLGITIVAGNSPLELGFSNAKKILKHMNRLDVPIYLGAYKPLKKDFINALDTHGDDGLGESHLEEVEGYEQSISAFEFLSSTLKEKTCDVIAIGPLTNLATLIEYDEEAFNSIHQIVSMGGAYKSHGNCSPVAEYNYWVDPEAAKIVYAQMAKLGKEIVMVGLDVTRKVVLTPNKFQYAKRLNREMGEFLEKITKFYFDFHWQWEHIIGCVINDPLAVAYYLNPDVCSGFSSFVDIETDGISRGQSVVDAYGYYKKASNALVLDQVDAYAFFMMFFERVLNVDPSKLDLLKDLG